MIRTKFPESHLISLHLSPESDNDIWVNVSVPDDDTFLAVSRLVSMREAEMLMETGYQITVMPFIEEAEMA